MMTSQANNEIYSAMIGGKPLKTYIKTILGKVYITVWDSFENVPVGMLLEGDPRRGDETSIIDIWSEEEDFFFKNKNKVHLTQGNVIAYTRKNEVKERTVRTSLWDDQTLVWLRSLPIEGPGQSADRMEFDHAGV